MGACPRGSSPEKGAPYQRSQFVGISAIGGAVALPRGRGRTEAVMPSPRLAAAFVGEGIAPSVPATAVLSRAVAVGLGLAALAATCFGAVSTPS